MPSWSTAHAPFRGSRRGETRIVTSRVIASLLLTSLCGAPTGSAASSAMHGNHAQGSGLRDRRSVLALPRALSARARLSAVRLRTGLTAEERGLLASDCAREHVPDRCEAFLATADTTLATEDVPAFLLDRTETTIAEYEACIRQGPCVEVRDPALGTFEKRHLPIAFVDRDSARQYCLFRGGRLPTRREFERAARGASSRMFPWGNLYHSAASNHGKFGTNTTDASDGYSDRAPVGSFPAGASSEGVLDLAGNVAEWVEHDPAKSVEAPLESRRDESHVCGGSFRTGAVGLAGAICVPLDAKSRQSDVGFR